MKVNGPATLIRFGATMHTHLAGHMLPHRHARIRQYIRGRLQRGDAVVGPATVQSVQSLEVIGRHFAAFPVGDELEAHLLTFAQAA
jgi:hypothetical protein